MDNLRRCFLTESEVKEIAIQLPKTGYKNMIVRKLYFPIPRTTDTKTQLYFSPCDSTGTYIANQDASSYANAMYYFRLDGNTRRFGITGSQNNHMPHAVLYDSASRLGEQLILTDGDYYTSSGSSEDKYGFFLFPVGSNRSGTTNDGRFMSSIAKEWLNDYYTKGEPLYMEVDIAPYGITNVNDESIVYDCMKLSTYSASRTAGDVYYVPV